MDPAEPDPVPVERRALRRLVATPRLRRRTGRNGRTSGGLENPSLLVGERQAAYDVGIAADPEQATVMHAVVTPADTDEIPRLGRPAPDPVHDVVNVDSPVIRAPGHAAA